MNTYKIVLFGPQGCGKGTQGEKLSDLLNIPLVVTGNIFRRHIKEQTALGKMAAQFINKGELVPNEITIKMISERLQNEDAAKGFILDGFPRSLMQAEALDKIVKLTHFLLIDISDQESIRRIANRRVCLKCGSTYHLDYKPSKKSGICDRCQEKLEQRADDTEEALAKRLKIYHQESEPILNRYQQQNIVHQINGEQIIEKVWQDIHKIFS